MIFTGLFREVNVTYSHFANYYSNKLDKSESRSRSYSIPNSLRTNKQFQHGPAREDRHTKDSGFSQSLLSLTQSILFNHHSSFCHTDNLESDDLDQ